MLNVMQQSAAPFAQGITSTAAALGRRMVLCVLVALGAWAGTAAHALEPGQSAPDFDLATANGRLKLSDLRGRTVYLDFWASWCGPCKQSFPWMGEMQTRYRAQGLSVVAIDVDQRVADGKAFLDRVKADVEVAFDPQGVTPKAYGVKAMPTSLLIGPDGKVIMVHGGFRMEDRAELEQRIRQALKLKE